MIIFYSKKKPYFRHRPGTLIAAGQVKRENSLGVSTRWL